MADARAPAARLSAARTSFPDLPFMSEDFSPDSASQRERSEALHEILAERILVLDGATGTWIQGQDLTAEDFGGPDLEGCNENLVFTRPDLIRRMHEEYFEAGADMVETDTFGSTRSCWPSTASPSKALEITPLAARLAREAAARWSTPRPPAIRRGSMGPTTKAITVTGGVDVRRDDRPLPGQAIGLLDRGRRHSDPRDRAGHAQPEGRAHRRRAGVRGGRLARPLSVSVTIEPMGTMLAGQAIEALYASIEHAPLSRSGSTAPPVRSS